MKKRYEMTLNNKKGFTLIELLVVIFIISIVATVALPYFSVPQTRTQDTAAQSQLRTVFKACQGFWTYNSSINPCLVDTVSNEEYGFVPSGAVEIIIESDVNNTEYDFYATASHISSSNVFEIDYKGVISQAGGVDAQDGGNSDDSGGRQRGRGRGNKGRGCSGQAQSNPHNLGQNAAGGCR